MDGMEVIIGTTSYVFPLEILPNVQRLKERVDDIELLLYESGNIPSLEIIKELKELSQQFNFTYTVHLPLDLKLTDANMGIRKTSVEKIIAIIENTVCLDPYGYILHINPNAAFKDLSVWQKPVRKFIKKIVENISICSSAICIENIDYPLEVLDEIIAEFDLSVCLDIGHLIQYKFDIKKYFQKYIDKARVIHLYGVNNSGLHGSLKKVDAEILKWVMGYINKMHYKGIVTLEVFSESDLNESLQVMKSISSKQE